MNVSTCSELGNVNIRDTLESNLPSREKVAVELTVAVANCVSDDSGEGRQY